MASVMTLTSVKKIRPDQAGAVLFDEVTAEIAAGERIALLGGSGQGKSTLLRIMALLEQSDGGALALHGKAYTDWQSREWRKRVCYVSQQPVMLPGSVEANLRTVSVLHGQSFDEALARQCMEAVGLGGVDWSRSAADLSGGEKQRTALVRSLLLRPELLLLDEITASLDPGSKHAVENWLVKWVERENAAWVWVTHDLTQAAQVSRTVWFMAENRLLEKRASLSFFNDPATEQARRYLEQGNDGEGRS